MPLVVQHLVFDYYEKICAQVRTSKWSTLFFLFDIGFFQGCVLSCILFNCVFQLALNLLKPLSDDGYHFKESNVINHNQAFADDLSITTASPHSNQRALDLFKRFFLGPKQARKCEKVCRWQ